MYMARAAYFRQKIYGGALALRQNAQEAHVTSIACITFFFLIFF
jgi:hypothetical protein